MSATIEIASRFVLGLSLVGGLLVLVRYGRAKGWPPGGVEGRLQASLGGAILGYTVLPGWQPLLRESALSAVFFFGGWFGLVAGLGLNKRSLRWSSAPQTLFEVGRAGVAALAIILMAYLIGLPVAQWPPLAALVMLGGICAAFPSGHQFDFALKGRITRWEVGFAPVGCVAIILIGAVSMPLRGIFFDIRLPFAPSFRGIAVDSLVAQMGWALVLGGVVGVLLDLLVRGAKRKALFFLIASGLAFGSGLAAALGLEPLWVGMIAGAWLINSTLHRLEIIETVERRHEAMRNCLYGVAGWLLGHGLMVRGIALPLFCWTVVIVALLRPVAFAAGGIAVRRLFRMSGFKFIPPTARWEFPEWEDLAIVAAVGLLELVQGAAGVALLAGVMIAQGGVRMIKRWRAPAGMNGPSEARILQGRPGS